MQLIKAASYLQLGLNWLNNLFCFFLPSRKGTGVRVCRMQISLYSEP